MNQIPSHASNPFVRRCSAYCTAENYRLQDLLSNLQMKGSAATFIRNSNVIHRIYGVDDGDVFYFSYGCVVMWGLSKVEEEFILRDVQAFEHVSNEAIESEESRYSVGDIAKISKDDMTIPSNDVITKLAFSHGLAQSVKLAIFEKLVERRIESSRHAPVSLAKFGRITMSRTSLARMMGELIIDRNSINLHTDILDTPEFFWENSDLEPLYRLIAQDLELSARVGVLNKRLDIVKDLYEMIGNELENRHSAHLEWIIIILIFIEIIIMFAKEVFQII